jgi:hypothetical protein
VQTAASVFGPDFPAASNLLEPITCGGGNLFCDAAYDRDVARASALEERGRGSANASRPRLDRKLVDEAASVPLFTEEDVDFVSRRVGSFQHHPIFGILFDQLWVR